MTSNQLFSWGRTRPPEHLLYQAWEVAEKQRQRLKAIEEEKRKKEKEREELDGEEAERKAALRQVPLTPREIMERERTLKVVDAETGEVMLLNTKNALTRASTEPDLVISSGMDTLIESVAQVHFDSTKAAALHLLLDVPRQRHVRKLQENQIRMKLKQRMIDEEVFVWRRKRMIRHFYDDLEKKAMAEELQRVKDEAALVAEARQAGLLLGKASNYRVTKKADWFQRGGGRSRSVSPEKSLATGGSSTVSGEGSAAKKGGASTNSRLYQDPRARAKERIAKLRGEAGGGGGGAGEGSASVTSPAASGGGGGGGGGPPKRPGMTGRPAGAASVSSPGPRVGSPGGSVGFGSIQSMESGLMEESTTGSVYAPHITQLQPLGGPGAAASTPTRPGDATFPAGTAAAEAAPAVSTPRRNLGAASAAAAMLEALGSPLDASFGAGGSVTSTASFGSAPSLHLPPGLEAAGSLPSVGSSYSLGSPQPPAHGLPSLGGGGSRSFGSTPTRGAAAAGGGGAGVTSTPSRGLPPLPKR